VIRKHNHQQEISKYDLREVEECRSGLTDLRLSEKKNGSSQSEFGLVGFVVI
jgi:hypothetical protein